MPAREGSGASFFFPAAPVTILVLLALTEGAGAQERQERPKYGTFRLGPLFLTPRLGFRAGVDDNVYNTPTGLSDQSLSATPTLQAVLPVRRRARLKATGGLVPQYFHREASERYVDAFGTTIMELDVGPLTAFGGVGGGNYRQRFSLEIDDRIRRHETNNVFGGTLRLGKRVTTTASQLSVTATYDPEASLDGNSVSVALDLHTVTRRLEMKVPLTRKTSVLPRADFVEDRFLQSSRGLPQSVRSQRYVIGLQFSELAFLNGRVAAGFHHFGDGEGVTPSNPLVLSVDVGMPFVLATRLQLFAGRDVLYSATPSTVAEAIRNTYVSSRYRSEILFELPLRLHGRMSLEYLEARYQQPPDTDRSELPRRDHTWTISAALLRHLGSHASLGVTVLRERRISPVDGHSYTGTILGLAGEVH
jgi:hypothetical protein